MLKERLPEVFVHLHRIPEQHVGFSGLHPWKMRTAETMRITPSTNLSAAAGTSPTKSPPATAPITDPTPIGATFWVRSSRSSKALRRAWRTTPTATVGKLIKRLAVPAVFTSTPNATKSVGMISSPPATPRRLLTNPILKPNSSAANTRTARASGSKRGTS
jgi:hypothetical protein